MKMRARADYIGNELKTSKAGKTFKLVRFLDEDGKAITAFCEDLNKGNLDKYRSYDILFEYSEVGFNRSLTYLTSEPVRDEDDE